MPDEKTPEQQALEAYQAAVSTVVAQGQEDYGATFDEMSQDVADAIGKENIMPVMASILGCDAPQRVIEHLSQFPERAKKIANMTPGRRAAELGRIEAAIMPNGLSDAGADPAWVTRARGGEKRGLGDELSDEQWWKNFQKKYPGRVQSASPLNNMMAYGHRISVNADK